MTGEQQALLFLHAVREDAALRALIERLEDQLTLEDLVALARARAFVFDERQLARAFAHGWAMRWAHRRAGRAALSGT
jgi:hypothetical protein